MENESGSYRSLEIPRSESKVTFGEKRGIGEVGEKSEFSYKRLKMRDLQSVFRSSEGSDTHCRKSLKSKEANDPLISISEIKKVTAVVNPERTATGTSQLVVEQGPIPVDLNSKVCVANTLNSDDNSECFHHTKKMSSPGKHEEEHNLNHAKPKSFAFDLNADEVSSSHDSFYNCKSFESLKRKDVSECASSIEPAEEKSPMRVWKEMKQNGFLSSAHGGIPMPKPRGRKSKNDGLKKKIELAKKEQVDRFAKIAAPSGLLNGLNPGIINHVRNSKQVHSIIEALVRSEQHANHLAGSKATNQIKTVTKETRSTKWDLGNLYDSGRHRLGFSCGDQLTYSLSARRQASECTISLNKCSHLTSEVTGEHDYSSTVERRGDKSICPSNSNPDNEDDMLALKLSSSTNITSENTSPLSTEVSTNVNNVSSLSVKAANVAYQWLDLLHEDVRGRLSALRRSRKRVQAVIQIELPLLMSREFSPNQENDPYVTKGSTPDCSDNVTADMHRARWNTLFDQMDKSLSEEETQLENWLKQVTEMRWLCERGLFQYHSTQGLNLMGSSFYNGLDKGNNSSEKELAIQAAAASIYSTCNFLMSMENLPCF